MSDENNKPNEAPTVEEGANTPDVSKVKAAKVSSPFIGCKDGEAATSKFKAGDVVLGDLAKAAVRAGNAKSCAVPKEEPKDE